MASGMASQLPGSYSRRILILLGLIVLIIHCRPWSYALFEQACEGERDLVEPTDADTRQQAHRTHDIAA